MNNKPSDIAFSYETPFIVKEVGDVNQYPLGLVLSKLKRYGLGLISVSDFAGNDKDDITVIGAKAEINALENKFLYLIFNFTDLLIKNLINF